MLVTVCGLYCKSENCETVEHTNLSTESFRNRILYNCIGNYIILLICREEVEDLTKEITSEILSGKVDQIAK